MSKGESQWERESRSRRLEKLRDSVYPSGAEDYYTVDMGATFYPSLVTPAMRGGQKFEYGGKWTSEPSTDLFWGINLEFLRGVHQVERNYSDLDSLADQLREQGQTIEQLKKEIKRLKSAYGLEQPKTHPTVRKGEEIYRALPEEYISKNHGQIVAIDLEKGEVVGKGGNVITAYRDALKHSKASKFYFKKVGYRSLFRVR